MDNYLEKEWCEKLEKGECRLTNIPEEQRTREIYLAAVKQNAWNLGRVPEDQRDEELCAAAVERDGVALCFTPEKYQMQVLPKLKDFEDIRFAALVPCKICTNRFFGEILSSICTKKVMQKTSFEGDKIKEAMDEILEKLEDGVNLHNVFIKEFKAPLKRILGESGVDKDKGGKDGK